MLLAVKWSQPTSIGSSSTFASERGRRPIASSMTVKLVAPRIVWWIHERYPTAPPLAVEPSAQNSFWSGYRLSPFWYCAKAFQYSSFLYDSAFRYGEG